VRLWSAFAALLLPLSLDAQECTLTLPVGVFSKDSQRIPALEPKDFDIRTDRIRIVAMESKLLTPRRFVVVLDASSSMRGSSRAESLSFEFARSIALRLVALAPANVGIGIVTLGSGPISRTEVTIERVLTKQAINDASADDRLGTTPLWDSLAEAHKLLTPPQAGDFIVLLTDSGSNTSKLSRRDITGPLVADSIRIFPIVLSHETPRTLDEYQGPDETDRLAQQTGGVQLGIHVPERGSLTFDQASETIATRTQKLARSYYGLVLQTDKATQGKKIKVRLTKPIAKTMLMHPENLPNCQTQP
jgi:hypothetical protein